MLGKMFQSCVLSLVLAFGAFGANSDSAPVKQPRIVSLNPSRQIVDPVPVPSDEPYKLSPGKIQVLKLNDYDKPVSWNVLQPINSKGVRVNVVEYCPIPKGSPAFGFMEGEKSAKKYVFESEVLVLVATGIDDGFVTVQAQVVTDGKIQTIAEMIVQVKSSNPSPPIPVPPGPGPIPVPPGPGPAPVPKGTVAWAIVVEETSQRTPELSAILGDDEFWKGLEAKGIKSRPYDKDNQGAKDRKYDVYAAEVGVPALLLMDSTGKKLDAVKLPLTKAGIQSAIDKVNK